jgi:hypothetical protein
VQIAYEPQGNTVEVQLRRWVTDRTHALSGCAETGDFVDVANPRENVYAQAAINDAAIANVLPGFYDDAIPAERFGETSLNLAELVEQAFRDECLAFRSVWMHSRSTPNAVTSNMQDYVAPHHLNLRTCSASGTKFFDLDADGGPRPRRARDSALCDLGRLRR